MSDPIDEALAELGLDEPDPRHLAALWGTLFAEPDLLRAWAEASAHPRLAAAYSALHQRVGARSEDVRPRLDAILGPEALRAATETAAEGAAGIEFELSRLKWLVANRATRAAAAEALGPDYDAAADGEEADVLHELLHAAGRGLC